ncbi:hypothetical protein NMY22_g5975 [Coprinellus aureogranulatus]|nr:hypothetical protein NMY22_g5975 [Coprinellus aureogranulatus]
MTSVLGSLPTKEPGSHSAQFPIVDRGLRLSDLHRFQTRYAFRIRKIEIGRVDMFPRYRLSPEFMEALVVATGGRLGALAPRLKTFHWACRSDESPGVAYIQPYLTLFIAPSVTSINLPTLYDPDASIAFTAARLPLLEDLCLRYTAPPIADNLLASESWVNLKSLVIESISDSTILLLASLRHLESLEFARLKGITIQHAHDVTSNFDGFYALRRLKIHSDTFGTAANFLQHIPPSTSLRVLRCSVSSLPPPAAAQHIIDTISEKIHKASLKVLEVKDSQDPEMTLEPGEVATSRGFEHVVIDIKALLEFTNLKDVSLCFQGRVQVTPPEVKMICSKWKELERLDLSGTYPIDRVPGIDHTHLFQLAEACPKLRYLSVPFDGRRIQGTERSAKGPFTAIEEVGVCGSPVEYPSCLAAFFMRSNFPSASLSRWYADGTVIPIEESRERWVDVAKAMARDGPGSLPRALF